MSQKEANGENHVQEEDVDMSQDKSVNKGKKRSVCTDSSFKEPNGTPGTNKRSTATPVKARQCNMFFPPSAVARSAQIQEAMGLLPAKLSEISDTAREHYSQPFYVRGYDLGEDGAYEVLVRHDEEAVTALETATCGANLDENAAEQDEEAEGGGEKANPIPGFTTHIPKKHDSSYGTWLAETFGEEGHSFFNSAHVCVIRHKETGVKHWVVNATRLPGAGKVFVASLAKKAQLKDFRGNRIDREQLKVMIERSQRNYQKELEEDPEAARSNDEEHLYVELISRGDISCHPCERAFLANMPQEVIMSHANITGYIAPRLLYNTIASMVARAASKSASKECPSKGDEGEEEEQQHHHQGAEGDGEATRLPATKKHRTASAGEKPAKKKTPKDVLAEHTALSVNLPVKSNKKAPAEQLSDHDAGGGCENVVDAVARNAVNYELIEEIGKTFAADFQKIIDAFELKQRSVLGLVTNNDGGQGSVPKRFLDPGLVSKIAPERHENGKRFVAAVSRGGAAREVVRALLFPSDKSKREDRLVETLSAISGCLAMKSDSVATSTPEKLKAEFEQLMALFSCEKNPDWKKRYMPEGKELDSKGMLMQYAHPKNSPMSRAFFMTGLVAGAVSGSEEHVEKLGELAAGVADLSRHYSESLKASSKLVEEVVARAQVQLSKAQKKLYEQFDAEKKLLIEEREKVERTLEKLREDNKALLERIAQLEAVVAEATRNSATTTTTTTTVTLEKASSLSSKPDSSEKKKKLASAGAKRTAPAEAESAADSGPAEMVHVAKKPVLTKPITTTTNKSTPTIDPHKAAIVTSPFVEEKNDQEMADQVNPDDCF